MKTSLGQIGTNKRLTRLEEGERDRERLAEGEGSVDDCVGCLVRVQPHHARSQFKKNYFAEM